MGTSVALQAVNTFLREQGREPLKATHRALLQQLREDGRLLSPDGGPLGEGEDPTRRVRGIGGESQTRAFTISWDALLCPVDDQGTVAPAEAAPAEVGPEAPPA